MWDWWTLLQVFIWILTWIHTTSDCTMETMIVPNPFWIFSLQDFNESLLFLHEPSQRQRLVMTSAVFTENTISKNHFRRAPKDQPSEDKLIVLWRGEMGKRGEKGGKRRKKENWDFSVICLEFTLISVKMCV